MHYWAPEVLPSRRSYDGQIDVWNAGCICAELLLGKPLLPGENSVHQLHAIIKLLGSPPEPMLTKETMQNVGTVVPTAVKATNYWELPAKEE